MAHLGEVGITGSWVQAHSESTKDDLLAHICQSSPSRGTFQHEESTVDDVGDDVDAGLVGVWHFNTVLIAADDKVRDGQCRAAAAAPMACAAAAHAASVEGGGAFVEVDGCLSLWGSDGGRSRWRWDGDWPAVQGFGNIKSFGGRTAAAAGGVGKGTGQQSRVWQ